MKKNGLIIIVAVVAFAAGFMLGANENVADKNRTKGDINAVNTYKQLLVAPEYMAFNDEYADNAEILAQTISTLQVMEHRISDFSTLAGMMNVVMADDPEISSYATQFQKTERKGQRFMAKVDEALLAANLMKAGEKVNRSKALKSAEEAFDYMNTQLEIGKQFVEAVDDFLHGKDVKEHLMVASMRDLVASHCVVNATLVQNDSEIDYWSNLNGLVNSEDMALSLE